MMTLLSLAAKSLWNRRFTAILTCVSIAIGTTLLLGVERIRLGARESFSNTISQTDLIVGGRSGPVSLLLYSVFHLGNATNNISMESYQHFHDHPAVAWTVPISLGDSHKGYRVVATNHEYVTRFHYAKDRSLSMMDGRWFKEPTDVVIGSEVASRLGYKVGSQIVLAHGSSGSASFAEHADHPFHVIGILDKTSTPVDRALYISLEAMEAIHVGFNGSDKASAAPDLTPTQITAFLLGAKSRLDVLTLQREINEYGEEPLTAILPALTLNELWSGVGYAESALRAIAIMVVIATFVGLIIAVVSTLNERRREIAVLRAVGASPNAITFLLTLETCLISIVATIGAVASVYVGGAFLQGFILDRFGIQVPVTGLRELDWIYLVGINLAGLITGLLAGVKASRNSLADGLQVRI